MTASQATSQSTVDSTSIPTEDGTATYYAPPDLASDADMRAQRAMLAESEVVSDMLEAVSGFALVLNSQRQIVAVNKRMADAFGVKREDIVGQRPGEAIGCLHASGSPNGCGTGLNCTTCGAGTAIFESQTEGCRKTRECRISVSGEDASSLDLEVVAAPLEISGSRLTVCTLRDISGEKRRRVLERFFFHDVLNTAGGLEGVARLLAEEEGEPGDDSEELKKLVVETATSLVEEIKDQQQLLAAESGDLEPALGRIQIRGFLEGICSLYGSHEVARGKELLLAGSGDVTVTSDPHLLRRVIINLIKNALEASGEGDTVTLRYEELSDRVEFTVHNPSPMPEDVRLQVFQRSFSTKGESGRGIGTYSVKMFGERYLGGKVSFTSREPDGTLFSFTVPKDWWRR